MDGMDGLVLEMEEEEEMEMGKEMGKEKEEEKEKEKEKEKEMEKEAVVILLYWQCKLGLGGDFAFCFLMDSLSCDGMVWMDGWMDGWCGVLLSFRDIVRRDMYNAPVYLSVLLLSHGST